MPRSPGSCRPVEKVVTNARHELIHDHADHCLDLEASKTDRSESKEIARYLSMTMLEILADRTYRHLFAVHARVARAQPLPVRRALHRDLS